MYKQITEKINNILSNYLGFIQLSDYLIDEKNNTIKVSIFLLDEKIGEIIYYETDKDIKVNLFLYCFKNSKIFNKFIFEYSIVNILDKEIFDFVYELIKKIKEWNNEQ